MIWIFENNHNDVYDTLDEAKEKIFALVGPKTGQEVYDTLKNGKVGTFYRKADTPLFKIVTEETGKYIRLREKLGNHRKDGGGCPTEKKEEN